MLIKRNQPATSGIFFAVWPRWTPDGYAALEWLHWEYVESWGWGSEGHYRYARASSPHELYDKGVRRKFWGGKTYDYATPPDISKCGKLRTDGPTPCHYPHCTCMNVGSKQSCNG
jgi:hypothetical protein